MKRSGVAYGYGSDFQKFLGAHGVPTNFWDVLDSPDHIQENITSFVTEEKKPVNISATEQKKWFERVTKTPKALYRNEKALICSWPNERPGLELACYLAATALKNKHENKFGMQIQVGTFDTVPTIKNLLDVKGPDLLVLHVFDLQATWERIQMMRSYYDSLDDLFLILVAVAEYPYQVENLLRRQFDVRIKTTARKVIK